MKKLIILATLLFAQVSFAGIKLDCAQNYLRAEFHKTDRLKTTVNYSCQSETDDFDVTISGYSIGIFEAVASTAVLSCPTVRKAALGVKNFVNKKGKSRKGTQTFVGVHADVAVFAGLEIGAFANSRGGLCQLLGVSIMALGADVGAVKMKVIKN